jgi:hypothetical protein
MSSPIPAADETLFFIDLDAVENLPDNAVLDLCTQYGLSPVVKGRLVMLNHTLSEDELFDAHSELSQAIRPAHLAVNLRRGLVAA